jgi:ABC-type uncharacterized transport system involved in gliding motility auxiliary subunit
MSLNLNSKQSTAGITALLVVAIVAVINYLVGGVGFGNFRIDLTEDKLYTLSDGTRNILERINADTPVTIRYYVSTDDRVMPPMLKTYARTVEDLLLEFEKASNGRLILDKLAPNPNTEDEDRAREDDLQGMQVNAEGDNIYLGMAVECLKEREVLPFMNPNEETSLEYNVARAINKVIATDRTVIGLMSAMPIQGSPMMPFQQQAQQQQAWIAIQRLKMDYEVREVPVGTDAIDDDISVLVIVHPADLSDGAQFAIDQYLLKGGKVMAFLDPQSWIAQAYSGQQNPMTGQQSVVNGSSDLPKLLTAWGLSFQKDMVVADVNYRSMMQGRVNPTALRLPSAAINDDDPITRQLQSVSMVSAGSFGVDEKEGITVVELLHSSEQSEMIDTTESERLRRESLTQFTPTGRKQVLGVRLTGRFKTAFPDGKPAGPPPATGETGGAQEEAQPKSDSKAKAEPKAAAKAKAPAKKDAPAKAPAAKEAPAKEEAKKEEAPKKPDSILESQNDEGVVILFSDVDMLYDAFCVSRDQLTGMLIPTNSNIPMFLNAVEVLSGGGDLLAVRSRASTQRPFKKLDEMREEVEKDFRPKLQALDAQLQEIAQKISTLRITRDDKTQSFVIDPQQAKDLQAATETQSEINREIREIKKEQNKELDRTEIFLTAVNVFGMPLVVIGIGVVLALRRRAATAAV